MMAGFDAAVEEVDWREDPWDETAWKEMVPSAPDVTAEEERLDALAQASDRLGPFASLFLSTGNRSAARASVR